MKVTSTPIDKLKEVFGYDSFRPLQEEVINTILSEKDTVAIFKTSGGKSLCYQVPALCADGTAIVISPLISLMKDQVDTLNELGIPSAYVNSTQSSEVRDDVLTRFSRGEYKLFYVSPERLSEGFFNVIQNVNISFLAVDEAHCVSLYGNDFRPSYTKIGAFFDALSEKRGKRIPRMALTATAPVEVREDIKKLLGMDVVEEFLGSFERENIDFIVRNADDKATALEEIIRQYSKDPLIVYCSTVKSVDGIYKRLTSDNFIVSRYHGQLSPAEKQINQDAFISGEINVMIATCAFGMGVDKSDVRTVVHYQLPGNLENYYQEAGRAGRDGKQSRAILLYSKNDRQIQDFFISSTYPGEDDIHEVMNFIYTLPSELMPLDTDVETLAQWCPGDIDNARMSAILRILSEHKLIDIVYSNEDSNKVLIETRDTEDFSNIDFSYIGKRRRMALENLSKMIDYAKTNRCRTEVVMKHFGQKVKECGHCDNCFNKKYFLDKDSCIPEEYVLGALGTIAALSGNYRIDLVCHVMQGVRNDLILHHGLNKTIGFGSFNTWTESGIKDLIDSMKKAYLLDYKQGNKPYITQQGEKVLLGEEHALVKVNLTKSSIVTREMFLSELVTKSNVKQATSVENADIDYDFLETVRKGRTYLSKHFNVQPNLLITESSLFEIVRKRPTNHEELQASGISDHMVDKYGKEILAVLKMCYKKHQVSEECDSF